MRPDFAILALSLLGSAASSAAGVSGSDDAQPDILDRQSPPRPEELWKRKGGGGGGGRGGGSGGSSGGSTGGSGGGSRGSPSFPGRGGSSDRSGGFTRTGSGPAPAYGGGRYYGGGSNQPYPPGRVSPIAGIAPFFLVGAVALAFWPGIWLYGAHMYPYHSPYTYYNQTARENQTRSILCGCDPYSMCGCDDNEDEEFLASVIGDGNYNTLNKSLVNTGVYEGNQTLFLNGTLPNGTTAPGGDDEVDSAGSSHMRGLMEGVGYWPMVAAVAAAIFMA